MTYKAFPLLCDDNRNETTRLHQRSNDFLLHEDGKQISLIIKKEQWHPLNFRDCFHLFASAAPFRDHYANQGTPLFEYVLVNPYRELSSPSAQTPFPNKVRDPSAGVSPFLLYPAEFANNFHDEDWLYDIVENSDHDAMCGYLSKSPNSGESGIVAHSKTKINENACEAGLPSRTDFLEGLETSLYQEWVVSVPAAAGSTPAERVAWQTHWHQHITRIVEQDWGDFIEHKELRKMPHDGDGSAAEKSAPAEAGMSLGIKTTD